MRYRHASLSTRIASLVFDLNLRSTFPAHLLAVMVNLKLAVDLAHPICLPLLKLCHGEVVLHFVAKYAVLTHLPTDTVYDDHVNGFLTGRHQLLLCH